MFKEMMMESDKVKMFIDKYFILTKNDADRVSKEMFLNIYEKHYNVKGLTLYHVKNDLIRLGVKYGASCRASGSDKGCFMGIKLKNDVSPQVCSPGTAGSSKNALEQGVNLCEDPDEDSDNVWKLKYEELLKEKNKKDREHNFIMAFIIDKHLKDYDELANTTVKMMNENKSLKSIIEDQNIK
jgi:hypothetical protein